MSGVMGKNSPDSIHTYPFFAFCFFGLRFSTLHSSCCSPGFPDGPENVSQCADQVHHIGCSQGNEAQARAGDAIWLRYLLYFIMFGHGSVCIHVACR